MKPVRIENRRDFGKALRTARVEAGVGMRDLGDMVHVCDSTMSARELGVRATSIEDASAMLDILGYALIIVKKPKQGTDTHHG
jgi:hypothetical protein